MSNFFILGLPRSRTAWITAYMHSKPVFCGHEVFSNKDYRADDFWDINSYKYKGSVDTDPRFADRYLVDVDAPLVLIERDVGAIYNSLMNKYDLAPKEVKATLEDMEESFFYTKSFANLVIKYKDLDERLPEICNLCIPEVGYDIVKHEMFRLLNIQSNQEIRELS